ncbi:MAG: adaptor protein MecA [Blautia sp.]|nr:adaptor protein MecA [Blautia sp.]
MKIEKINDNQIRCTLTRQDLENHQIHLSELAYGSEKTKQLFRDMMQQAQIQFGFEADNIPLMIEAIPVSTESIILIITKVEDPEELDTRFSKFTPFKGNSSSDVLQFDGADNILDLFQKIREAKERAMARKAGSDEAVEVPEDASQSSGTSVSLIRMYSFSTLDNVVGAAHSLAGFYDGANALYRDPQTGEYCLIVHQSGCTPEEFNKVCNILSEYGSGRSFTESGEAYFQEHGELISRNALQLLVQL